MPAALGSLASQGGSFVTSIVAARNLGRDAYGQFGIIQSTALAVASVAGAGLGITATRYISALKDRNPARAGEVLGLVATTGIVTGAVFGVMMFLGAPFIAASGFKASHLTAEFAIASVYVLFLAMNGVQLGALTGFEAFRSIAAITGAHGVLSVLLMSVLVTRYGLLGATYALVVTSASLWTFCQLQLRRQCARHRVSVKCRSFAGARAVFSAFAFPAALSGIIGQVAVWAANALLIRQTGSFAEMGVFSAANTMRLVVLFAPGVLTRVALPLLCKLKSAELPQDYRDSVSRAWRLNVLIALTVAALVLVTAPTALLIFGKDYREAWPVVVLLLPGSVLEVAAWSFQQVLVTNSRIWWHLWIVILWSGILVLVTNGWAGRYGARALAAAYLLAWSASALSYIVLAHALLGRPALDPLHDRV